MRYDIVFHCVVVCAHVFGCVTISACQRANVASCDHVAVPDSTREEMAKPSKKK